MFPEKTTDLSQGTDQLYPIINDLRLDVDVASDNTFLFFFYYLSEANLDNDVFFFLN
jgi:hypothetical protein